MQNQSIDKPETGVNKTVRTVQHKPYANISRARLSTLVSGLLNGSTDANSLLNMSNLVSGLLNMSTNANGLLNMSTDANGFLNMSSDVNSLLNKSTPVNGLSDVKDILRVLTGLKFPKGRIALDYGAYYDEPQQSPATAPTESTITDTTPITMDTTTPASMPVAEVASNRTIENFGDPASSTLSSLIQQNISYEKSNFQYLTGNWPHEVNDESLARSNQSLSTSTSSMTIAMHASTSNNSNLPSDNSSDKVSLMISGYATPPMTSSTTSTSSSQNLPSIMSLTASTMAPQITLLITSIASELARPSMMSSSASTSTSQNLPSIMSLTNSTMSSQTTPQMSSPSNLYSSAASIMASQSTPPMTSMTSTSTSQNLPSIMSLTASTMTPQITLLITSIASELARPSMMSSSASTSTSQNLPSMMSLTASTMSSHTTPQVSSSSTLDLASKTTSVMTSSAASIMASQSTPPMTSTASAMASQNMATITVPTISTMALPMTSMDSDLDYRHTTGKTTTSLTAFVQNARQKMASNPTVDDFQDSNPSISGQFDETTIPSAGSSFQDTKSNATIGSVQPVYATTTRNSSDMQTTEDVKKTTFQQLTASSSSPFQFSTGSAQTGQTNSNLNDQALNSSLKTFGIVGQSDSTQTMDTSVTMTTEPTTTPLTTVAVGKSPLNSSTDIKSIFAPVTVSSVIPNASQLIANTTLMNSEPLKSSTDTSTSLTSSPDLLPSTESAQQPTGAQNQPPFIPTSLTLEPSSDSSQSGANDHGQLPDPLGITHSARIPILTTTGGITDGNNLSKSLPSTGPAAITTPSESITQLANIEPSTLGSPTGNNTANIFAITDSSVNYNKNLIVHARNLMSVPR